MELPSADFVLTGTQIVLTGIGIGIVIAAPVGPVNVLCIQRTVERGFWGGVAAGLGAVAGDGLIAAAAAYGLTAVSSLFASNKQAVQLIGGLILTGFGWRLLWVRPSAVAPDHGGSRLTANVGVMPQTFFLTVTNPGAILGIFAIFGGVGTLIGGLKDLTQASLIVVGVMCGSMLWWTVLSWLISILRHRLDEARLRLINQFAGVSLIGFGAGLMARLATTLIEGA